MKKVIGFTLALLAFTTQPSAAARLVNDMQSCQAWIDFINNKLESAPSKYDDDDIIIVREGLDGYNQYIQHEIVSPGLLQFTGGDKSKADDYQNQVDTYKESLVVQLDTRYPQNRLFSDYAIAINNCAKKSVPSGQELEDLKAALNTMLKLAELN
jgi:hypothetical protein